MKEKKNKSVKETIVGEFNNLSPAEEHSILESEDFEFVNRQIKNLQKDKNLFLTTGTIIGVLVLILVIFFFKDKPLGDWFYLVYVIGAIALSIKFSLSYTKMKKRISLYKILKSYYDNQQ
ncbi:MAG: hypothetical protein U9N76_07085 [Candidatus Marinimicrobia bacterium]|nr:hypothetical protein [Candidatus Neomarinimicrobiota bacterium]